jgi:NitT/TauT family transport system permease protein
MLPTFVDSLPVKKVASVSMTNRGLSLSILSRNASTIVVFIMLFVIWDIVCRIGNVPEWLLPAPSRIAQEVWNQRALIPLHLFTTTYEVVLGFAVAVVLGVSIAVLIVLSTLARKLIYPILLLLQSVPKVALAPILLLWVGYGLESKILLAAITAVFPIIINTSTGMQSAPEEMLELTRSLRSSALKVFWKVRLPNAMPYLFGGMKIAIPLSLIGAVVGEFVGADRGLGYLILTYSSTMNTALVFGAMFILAFLGMGLFYLVALAERILCPWYAGKN